jgi:hypothetical protein
MLPLEVRNKTSHHKNNMKTDEKLKFLELNQRRLINNEAIKRKNELGHSERNGCKNPTLRYI